MLEPENRITYAWIILQMNQHYFANSCGYLCGKITQINMVNQNYFANGFLQKCTRLSILITFKQIQWKIVCAKPNQKWMICVSYDFNKTIILMEISLFCYWLLLNELSKNKQSFILYGICHLQNNSSSKAIPLAI